MDTIQSKIQETNAGNSLASVPPSKHNVGELVVRFKTAVPPSDLPFISCSNDAAAIFRAILDEDTIQVQEQSIALYLNKGNKVVGAYNVSRGGITSTVIDLRIILAVGLKVLATGLIICHNHPSGNLKPSNADLELTRKLKESAAMMDIALLDHLILSPETYYSFADEGII